MRGVRSALMVALLIPACDSSSSGTPGDGAPPTSDGAPAADAGVPGTDISSADLAPGVDVNTGPPTIEEAFPGLPDFARPVDLQHAPDGSGRLFVVQQGGEIFVFDNQPGVATRTLFLDISGQVQSQADGAGNEAGLLGLAFHPDYAKNGHLYLNYTAKRTAGSGLRTVVARFTVSAADPLQAEPASELELLSVDQPYNNHNGGQLAFGPDGYLYIALGDGGSGGDPQGNGQDPNTLLGAILRIDVDQSTAQQPYGIPADNPFVNGGGRPEVWAYGLRNPWRFSFDADTGELWVGDVGQGAWEEIDRVEKGKNYGWNVMEGKHCYKPASGCDQSGLELPVVEYDHGQGQSVTGGFVYRGQRVVRLQGKYVFADFVSGRIWTHDPGPATTALLLESGKPISSFGVDAAGELYLCAFDGRIYRFR